MSGTMMHHGGKALIVTFQFNSLVLFSTEKRFTLSEKRFTLSLACFVPIWIGCEQGGGLEFFREVSCKIQSEHSPFHGMVGFFHLNSLVLRLE